MDRFWPTLVRPPLFAVLAAVIVTATATDTSFAQSRMGGMKDRIVDDVANDMVRTIASDSCADFEAMVKGRKSKSGGSSRAGGMMKRDPEARAFRE